MGTPASSSLISLREAAERLGMSTAQLRELARQGRLPASKHAGRWLVESGSLAEFEPPQRRRAREAQGRALADIEHGLRGHGALVGEPVRSRPQSRAAAAARAALDEQLGLTTRSDAAQAGGSPVRQAQRRNLEALAERLDKPHPPERSI